MPTIPIPRFNDFTPDDIGGEEFLDRLTKLSRSLEYITSHMDHDNVRRLHTEECTIQSQYGETYINGPQLKMYSSGAAVEGSTSPGTLRLKMGYDSASGNFVFNMYAQNGSEAVSLNSTGYLKLSGKPLIEMYGDSTTKRLQMGHTTAAGDDFVFNLYNSGGVKTISINSSGDAVFTGTITGSTIIGGTIKTADTGGRIELRDSNFFMYNSSNQLEGLVFGSTLGTWGDVHFYNDGAKVAEFYYDPNTMAFRPATTNHGVQIGKADCHTYVVGNVHHSGSGCKIGFFNTSPVAKTAVSTATSTTVDSLNDKLNELISALKTYGIV